MLPVATASKKSFSYALIIVLLATVLVPLWPAGVQAGWRLWTAARLRVNFREWQTLETKYFHLRYPAQEAAFVQRWAAEADTAARKVNELLRLQPVDKPWLVFVPDQATMQKIFGWSDGTRSTGVYQAGTIMLLSPEAWDWVPPERRISAFLAENPLIHEYTHFVLDSRAKAYYPRWFSEGLAQMLALRLQGTGAEATGNRPMEEFYLLEELESNFDRVETETAAYIQAYRMVNFLAARKGMEGIITVIELLSRGKDFAGALKQVYATSQEEFFNLWRLGKADFSQQK